jgi:hypothetical protein
MRENPSSLFSLFEATARVPPRDDDDLSVRENQMAEGVGLLPTNRKALKINERFGHYVLQDYRTSVPVGNAKFQWYRFEI